MEYYEIVEKLIGPVTPLGDASRDGERFENLTALCNLTEKLAQKIKTISDSKTSFESSVKRIGEKAQRSLDELKEIIEAPI